MPSFDTQAELDNWNACKRACKGLNSDEMEIVEEIYTNRESIAYMVSCVARERKMKSSDIWSIIDSLERRIAKERGLI